MNRQQRRAEARKKKQGWNYMDVMTQKQIGKETLRMAMEDEAVRLAADIICQRQLWAVVVALNEQFQFGAKRTRELLEAMDLVLADFETIKANHGDDVAEEKLRERASKVSGINVRYMHEAERNAMEQMREAGADPSTADPSTALAGGPPPLQAGEVIAKEGGQDDE